MTDQLQQGARWLQDRQRQHVARTVTYRRGALSVQLQATAGRTEFEQATDYGIALQSEARDFVVHAADLVLGGARIEPEVGDRIEETIDGTTHQYEVMAIGGQQCFRYVDADYYAMRIHTKRIGVLP